MKGFSLVAEFHRHAISIYFDQLPNMFILRENSKQVTMAATPPVHPSSQYSALRTTITHWRVRCDRAEGLSLLMEPDRLQCACRVALTQVIWFSPALDQLKPWLYSELLRFRA